jgi:uncharacterized integral membrane protein
MILLLAVARPLCRTALVCAIRNPQSVSSSLLFWSAHGSPAPVILLVFPAGLLAGAAVGLPGGIRTAPALSRKEMEAAGLTSQSAARGGRPEQNAPSETQ